MIKGLILLPFKLLFIVLIVIIAIFNSHPIDFKLASYIINAPSFIIYLLLLIIGLIFGWIGGVSRGDLIIRRKKSNDK